MSKLSLLAAGLILAAAPTLSHAASVNLVQNGGFETTTLTSSQQFVTGQIANWSNATTSGYTGYGYNFIIIGGTADTTGFTSRGGNHDTLWGPDNGVGSSNYSNNGFVQYSPTGGNYLIADGDSNFHGAISQSIGGLVAGTQYQLTFDWGAGQFSGTNYNMATTEAWQVSLGGDTQSTATLNTAGKGFDNWRTATMTFTASAASEVLSFLANGTPNGEPPTLLLDNVSLTAVQSTAVPEPASLALLGMGLTGFVAMRRRRA